MFKKSIKYGFLVILMLGCSDSNESPEKISSNDIYVSQADLNNSTLTEIDNNESNFERDDIHFVDSNNSTSFTHEDNISTTIGIRSNPFNSITDALSNIKNTNITLYIDGGEYTQENGEIFPINIPKGIKLLKSDKNDKNITIEGFGLTEDGKKTAIVLNGDTTLQNISISSLDNIGILSLGGENVLNTVTLSNNKNALGLLNDSKIVLENTLIKDNSHIGIELSNNSSLKLVNSTITESNIGLYVSDNAMIDSTLENSKVIKNEQCDLFSNGSQNLKLQHLEWDDSVFDFNIQDDCINGENIVSVGTGMISYQPIPNSLLFPNIENEILILSPEFEEVISTTEPTITYTNTQNSKYIMVTLWSKLPIVVNNEIKNPKDILWYWHSGMNNSPIGRIDYNQGAKAIDGNLNMPMGELIRPSPLEEGRAYYLAIWEWDTEGINIVSSSSISYFMVSN